MESPSEKIDTERRRQLAETIMQGTVRRKPSDAQFAPPVAWMLGPEMFGALKQFALHALYKGEFDPHDWMVNAPIVYPEPTTEKDFWFDFIADIGDGQRAMYTTALVLQDDLYIEGELTDSSRQRATQLPALGAQLPSGWSTLPRGHLVVVGGDTAYPLADYVNIDSHVRQPFTWAYRDLVAAGRLTDDKGAPHALVDLYGVPGNHDYYDLLVGYGRMYRTSIIDGTDGSRAERLPIDLPGFRRCQTASYVGLELPWQWRLWAIDPGERDLDYRQECFFREHGVADKMIVVTPSPSVVFGRVLAERGFLDTMNALGLALPFMGTQGDAALLRDGKPADPSWPTSLQATQCRVDLAGDMHCYQRYGAVTDDGKSTTNVDAVSNYASVVSGAGGAFSHSTATDFGERQALAQYPTPDQARKVFSKKLFSPLTVFNNGVVNMSTFVLALVICAGSIRFDTRIVTDTILRGLGVNTASAWSGGTTTKIDAGWHHYLVAALVVSAFAVSFILIALALRYAMWVTRSLRKPFAEWPNALRLIRKLPGGGILQERGFLPSWVLTLVALCLPAIVPQLVSSKPSAAAVLFQILFITVVIAIVGSLLLVAMSGGAEYQRPKERWFFAVLGTLHALMQILLPLIIVRVGLSRPVSLVTPLAVYVGLAWLGQRLYQSTNSWARHAGIAIWFGHAVIVIASIVVVADGNAIEPNGTYETIGFLFVAGIVGAVIGCFEFGWYLAVASSFNGHNNEAGAAARVDSFRQFIRFRVQPHCITGYVVAIDELGTDVMSVKPRIVDIFTVAPQQMR
jgi:hypothetical protein